jgi:Holliday junction resolvase RusA-like endonuclease
MNQFSLTVLGKPHGKGRPRFGNGRTYTDKPTQLAEAAIQRAWEDAGHPRIDGPVRLRVILFTPRPQSHYKADLTLSTEGLRYPYPSRQKPDLDNALKLLMDALNGRAWEDDVRVVDVTVCRLWGAQPYTWMSAQEMEPLEMEKAA